MSFSSPNGAPDPNQKPGWSAVVWGLLLKLQNHAGKILWVPLLMSMATFAANLVLALADDGVIDEQEFHSLLQGASGSEMVILAVVMALLKIRKP